VEKIMNKSLKELAYALAGGTPTHLGVPTLPPIRWAQNGDQVIVILADGRKISASIEKINELMFSQGVGAGVPLAQSPVKPAMKSTTPSKKVVKK
jgi:hypothetical protein